MNCYFNKPKFEIQQYTCILPFFSILCSGRCKTGVSQEHRYHHWMQHLQKKKQEQKLEEDDLTND